MRVPINPQVTIIRREKSDPSKMALRGPDGFASRLRSLRERADISLREQDRLAGLALGHSAQFESGRQGKLVSARSVAQLATVYGTNMEWLFIGRGDAPTQTHLDHSVAQAFARLEAAEDKYDAAMDLLNTI